MKVLVKRMVAISMVVNLLGLWAPGLASAALMTTETAVTMSERAERVDRIDQMLSRGDVREQLVAFGVDADEARLRVAALSDSELQQLEAGIASLPAGGDGGVIWILGAVFVVLLVLEILGVTHVFTGV